MGKEDYGAKLQWITAGLFRPSNRRRLDREMEEDEAAIYAVFKEIDDKQRSLALFRAFRRHLLNSAALASFHGNLRGREYFVLGSQLGRVERAIITYLYGRYKAAWKQRGDHSAREPIFVSDREICKHLDTLNSRRVGKSKLSILDNWVDRLPKNSGWERALDEIPNPVSKYLSLVRKKAKDTRLLNAMYVWPRIAKQYEKTKTANPKAGRVYEN